MLAVDVLLDWRFTLIALVGRSILFIVVYALPDASSALLGSKKEESEVFLSCRKYSLHTSLKAFAREDYEQERFERQSLGKRWRLHCRP